MASSVASSSSSAIAGCTRAADSAIAASAAASMFGKDAAIVAVASGIGAAAPWRGRRRPSVPSEPTKSPVKS